MGHIIECINNKNLTEYFQTNIFLPLNMTNTGFSHLNFDQGDLITPYHWDENLGGAQGYYMELPFYNIPPVGNTGLMTSIPDLAKFLIAHMNEGQYNNVHILNESSINQMHSSVLSNYGYGWHTDPEKGQGHTGEEWGYRVELRYFPSGEIAPEKVGIIFISNTGGNDMSTQKDSLYQFIRNWFRYEIYSNNQVIDSFQINLIGLLAIIMVVLLILKQFRDFES